MKQHGSQKFIERNRPPRVQISCDEEANGARIKVNLPFVAGVLADLSGKWEDPGSVPKEFTSARGEFEDRDFLEIDQGNFGERMKAFRPTVSFNVPNVLTGEGPLGVDITFESMDDFNPDRIAEKIPRLRELLEIRKKLKGLLDRASNKPALEKALERIVSNPALIKLLSESTQ